MLESIDIAKVIVAFIITIFLILSIYYGIVKYGKGIPSLNQKGQIKIKEVKYISKGKSLVLVEVNNKEILFSVTEKDINVVEKWEKKEDLDPPQEKA